MSCNTCGKQTCICEKRISTQGRSGKPGRQGPPGPQGPAGPAAQLFVNNTVFVMKNGNDSTGLVQRFDKPFLTIAAARAAALSAFTARTNDNRIRIVVETGFYNEKIILDKFIDYDLNDSVIDGEITDDKVDFGSSADGVWTNIIYGTARIHNTRPISTNYNHAMQIYRPNSKVLIYCTELAGDFDNAIAITNGYVRIHCERIYSNNVSADYGVPLEITQGGQGPEYNLSVVEVIGADIYNVPTSPAPPVAFTFGGTDKNQVLTLINCRVSNLSTSTSGGDKACIAVGNQSSSNARINLYNTVLYAVTDGASIYTETGNTTTLKCYHSNMSNVNPAGAGTLTVSLGSITVNAAVGNEIN